jgi:argininosuccinate lyase
MDAVSDRDFALDFLNCVSIGMMHLSRLSEEMITWSSQEWNFMTFDDEYSTGSSLMPQKKNPDITELIRGKTARVFGNQFTLLSILKGLPLSYNRDLQEDKEPVFDSFNQYFNALNLMKAIIKSAKFNKNRFVEELNGDYIFATDIAEWLVKQGIPFREAHGIVGQLVKHAVSEKKSLNELSLDEYRKFSPLFDESVYNLCSVEGCLERKITYGSPNPKLVLKQIMDYKKLLGM